MCYIFILSSAIEVILIELILQFYKPFVASNCCGRFVTSWGCVHATGDEQDDEAVIPKSKMRIGKWTVVAILLLNKPDKGNQHRRICCNYWCLFWNISATCDTKKETSNLTVSSSYFHQVVDLCVFSQFAILYDVSVAKISLGRDQLTSVMQQQNCNDQRTKGASGVCGTYFCKEGGKIPETNPECGFSHKMLCDDLYFQLLDLCFDTTLKVTTQCVHSTKLLILFSLFRIYHI